MNPGEADCNEYSAFLGAVDLFLLLVWTHFSSRVSRTLTFWRLCKAARTTDDRSSRKTPFVCSHNSPLFQTRAFYLAARGANSAAAATNNKKSPAGFFFLLCIWPRLPDESVKKLLIFLFILIADVNEKIFCQMLIFGAKIFTTSLKYELFWSFCCVSGSRLS